MTHLSFEYKCEECLSTLDVGSYINQSNDTVYFNIITCSNCLEVARLEGYEQGLQDALKTVETGGK